jgi:hypothetical protein
MDAVASLDAMHYKRLTDDRIVTPIRNAKHLVVVHLTHSLAHHPWAAFLLWYSDKYDKDVLETLTEKQKLSSLAGYTLRFRCGSTHAYYDVKMKRQGQHEFFDIYNKDAETRCAELLHLKRRVRFLERAYAQNLA